MLQKLKQLLSKLIHIKSEGELAHYGLNLLEKTYFTSCGFVLSIPFWLTRKHLYLVPGLEDIYLGRYVHFLEFYFRVRNNARYTDSGLFYWLTQNRYVFDWGIYELPTKREKLIMTREQFMDISHIWNIHDYFPVRKI